MYLEPIMYDENDQEIRLPTHKIVCPDCRGEGTHALHGLAITADEWAEWDEDDRETYRNGGYDTVCETCNGLRVLDEVDEGQMSPEELQSWHEWERDAWAMASIERSERMIGA